ncbi:MAG: PilZ domain-containing protein [Candidatus Omnitrophica bacterium]|nr:PilZ domain-containing protein [Candidatus Omnitrophota bacterium]
MENGKNGQNHRKSARTEAAFTLSYSIEKPFELRITLGLPDETGALMRDLSDLGAAIITKYDIPLGTLLRVKFNLMNLRLVGEKRLRRIEVIAQVMSNSVMPDESHRIGIRFDKISEEDKAAIRDFVQKDKK